MVAATARALFATANHYSDFSHKTARKALHHNLPARDVLTERLVDALHAVAAFSRRDRLRRNECDSKPSGARATMEWVTEKSRPSVQTRVRVWLTQRSAKARGLLPNA